MQPATTPPPKLFREEAQVGAVQCPNCGGPITRSGFGAIEEVVCPYCGSELGPADNGALEVLVAAQRAQRQSVLPLHARGKLGDIEWEIIGIVWREALSDGVYPWQEFLLYNPYHGYRYLLFFVYDGHFALGTPLAGAPQFKSRFGHDAALFGGQRYKHFQSCPTRVTYAEGEFPWQVRVGDQSAAMDYVAPPEGLSVEQTPSEDGVDLNFTRMEHLEGKAVWKAFGMAGKAPRPSQVGPYSPNPWRRGRRGTWVSLGLLLLLWVAASLAYLITRDREILLARKDLAFEPLTEEIQLGEPGGKTTLEVEFSAGRLDNSWAYAEVLLIPHDRDKALAFGLEVDEWHGVTAGESWREGNSTSKVSLGAVPTGAYTLQVTPQSGSGAASTSTPSPAPNLTWNLTVRRDVPLLRYVLLPLIPIFGFPILLGLLGLSYEHRRWAQSDHASG